MSLYTVELPDSLLQRLQQFTKGDQRSVDEWVQQTLTRNLPPLVDLENDLSPALHSEFEAMATFSDAALWVLAKGMLSTEQLAEWDGLVAADSERELSAAEAKRKEALGREYDEMILRRAHAAMLLTSRGHDLSNPATLRA